jgi:hypothetical protein
MSNVRPSTFDPSDRTYHIPLTKGYVAIIDEIDSDLIAFNWCALGNNAPSLVYAQRRSKAAGIDESILIHRVILGRMIGRPLLESELVDHVDRNGLNCRRSNLRIANSSQNQINQKLSSLNTSGYKGIYWHKKARKWHATIGVYGKTKSLGYYDDPSEAHKAYMRAAREYYGEFANDGYDNQSRE